MYRVLFDGLVLHDPRMDGERLTACTIDAEDNAFPSLSMDVPYDHPLHDRLVAMSPLHEVTVEHDGTEVFRGRLLKLPEDMSGTITVGAEGQLAYLRDTRVAPYGTYADTSDSPAWSTLAPATAREYVEWLIAQHNAKDGSKGFALGACPLGTDAITRSSTQAPTTWQELTDKVLTPFSLHARARYEGGTRWLDLLSDDMCLDSGQVVTPSTNLIDMSTTEDWSDVVTAIHATGTADTSVTGSTAPTLDSVADGPVTGHDGVSVTRGCVVSESGLMAHGWVEDWRTYDATTAAALLDEAADDVATAHEVLASIEVSAVDLSLVDPATPRLALLDYVRVRCPARGVDQSMLCTKESVDVCDPSQSRWTLGALLPTLSRGLRDAQARVRRQTEQTVTDVASISQAARDAATAATAAQKTADSAVVATHDEYAASASSDTAPTTGWSSEQPVKTSGDYIWRRVVSVYGDGSEQRGSPAVMTGNSGADGVVLSITSTHGLVFKDSLFSTVLEVSVMRGSDRITDQAALAAAFGSTARIEWRWQRDGSDAWGTILSSDPRVIDGGFSLTVSPSDVDARTSFLAQLLVN